MLRDVLHHLGETTKFKDEDFERAFVEFDVDKSQTIEKDEMKLFLLKMVCI